MEKENHEEELGMDPRQIILVLVASKMHLLPRAFVSYVSWDLELKKTLNTYLKNRINSPQLKEFRSSLSTIKSS